MAPAGGVGRGPNSQLGAVLDLTLAEVLSAGPGVASWNGERQPLRLRVTPGERGTILGTPGSREEREVTGANQSRREPLCCFFLLLPKDQSCRTTPRCPVATGLQMDDGVCVQACTQDRTGRPPTQTEQTQTSFVALLRFTFCWAPRVSVLSLEPSLERPRGRGLHFATPPSATEALGRINYRSDYVFMVLVPAEQNRLSPSSNPPF